MAPRADCKAQSNHKAPEPRQEDAMRCLINYARQQVGAGGIGHEPQARARGGRKVGDVVDCGLSHTACGKPAFYYPERFGYTRGSWRAGREPRRRSRQAGHGAQGDEAVAELGHPMRDTMLGGSFERPRPGTAPRNVGARGRLSRLLTSDGV